MDNTRLDGSHKGDSREVLLVRHGQSTANATGVWQGQLDFPLSELGRRQAEEAGRALKGWKISGIYASPLARAFETAEILAASAGYEGEVVPVSGFEERHGGVLEGSTWAEQESRNPEFAREFLSLPEEKRWAMASAETDEEVLARFEAALSSILARNVTPGEDRLVLVTHGGVMRAYLRDRFGPEVLPGTQRAPNASITRLQFGANGDGPYLSELAFTGHLSSHEDAEPAESAESL